MQLGVEYVIVLCAQVLFAAGQGKSMLEQVMRCLYGKGLFDFGIGRDGEVEEDEGGN